MGHNQWGILTLHTHYRLERHAVNKSESQKHESN